eukprot:95490_1
MATTLQIVNIIVSCVTVITGCLMICWLLTFHYLTHISAISQRRPNTTLFIGILQIVGSLLAHNVQLIFLNTESIPYVPYINLLFFIMVCCTASGSYHLLTYRAFMVYYDIKWNKAIQDSKWRMYIDPNETNWFLKNKNTWGSSKRLLIIAFIHWSIYVLVGSISILQGDPHTPSNQFARMCVAAPGIILITIDTIIYFKMPSFNDIYWIHQETKLLLRFKILFLTSYYIITVLLSAKPYTIQYAIVALIGILSYFFLMLITIYYVLKQLQLPTNPYFARKFVNAEFMNFNMSSYSLNSAARKPVNHPSLHDVHQRLRQVLESKHGFNSFARHLTKEFCLENLLFFVETQQWLHALGRKQKYKDCIMTQMVATAPSLQDNVSIEMFTNNKNNKLTHDLIQIHFPETAPKSIIVEHDQHANADTNKKDDEFPSDQEYLQCVALFKKYIANEACFCINIDSITRNQLYAVFNGVLYSNKDSEIVEHLRKKSSINAHNLFHLFDGCRSQIFQLLTFAYQRFQKTEEYRLWAERYVKDDTALARPLK